MPRKRELTEEQKADQEAMNEMFIRAKQSSDEQTDALTKSLNYSFMNDTLRPIIDQLKQTQKIDEAKFRKLYTTLGDHKYDKVIKFVEKFPGYLVKNELFNKVYNRMYSTKQPKKESSKKQSFKDVVKNLSDEDQFKVLGGVHFITNNEVELSDKELMEIKDKIKKMSEEKQEEDFGFIVYKEPKQKVEVEETEKDKQIKHSTYLFNELVYVLKELFDDEKITSEERKKINSQLNENKFDKVIKIVEKFPGYLEKDSQFIKAYEGLYPNKAKKEKEPKKPKGSEYAKEITEAFKLDEADYTPAERKNIKHLIKIGIINRVDDIPKPQSTQNKKPSYKQAKKEEAPIKHEIILPVKQSNKKTYPGHCIIKETPTGSLKKFSFIPETSRESPSQMVHEIQQLMDEVNSLTIPKKLQKIRVPKKLKGLII